MVIPVVTLYEKVKKLFGKNAERGDFKLQDSNLKKENTTKLTKVLSFYDWQEEINKLMYNLAEMEKTWIDNKHYAAILYIIFTGKVDLNYNICEDDILDVSCYLEYCSTTFAKRREQLNGNIE